MMTIYHEPRSQPKRERTLGTTFMMAMETNNQHQQHMCFPMGRLDSDESFKGNFYISRKSVALYVDLPYETIKTRSRREGWESRVVKGSSGRETQILVSSLPEDLRQKVLAEYAKEQRQAALERLAARGVVFDDEPAPTAEEQARLARATPDQLELVNNKLRLIELFQKEVDVLPYGEKTRAADKFCEAFKRGSFEKELNQYFGGVSRRTLERWSETLRKKGPAGLLERRGRPPGGTVTTKDIREFVRDTVRSRPRIPASNLYRLMLVQFRGQLVPSRRMVRRLVAQVKKDEAEQLLQTHQPSLHKRLYQISLGRADADLTAPNQRWEIDSTRGDIMGRRRSKVIEIVGEGGKRFTLIAVMDVYSRRPVVLMEEKGGGHNINLALIKSIRRLGLPLSIIMDLGKDYQSRAVQTFCASLGIETPTIPGYSPELKPHIERFFATLQGQLFANLPGYTANKLADRQEVILAKMSREQIQKSIDQWIEVYERREHGTIGEAPLHRGNPEGWVKKTVPEEQLRLLLNPPVERSIRQGFIAFERGRYYHQDLKYMDGSARVLVRSDPDDAGIIHVFNDHNEFLFTATDLARLSLTPDQIAAERRAWKKVRKLRRDEYKATEKALDLVDLTRRALDYELASAPPDPPDPLVDEVSFDNLALAVESKAAVLYPVPDAVQEEEFVEKRPLFSNELERYEWALDRLSRGLEIETHDAEWMRGFEQTPLYRDLGGDDYRAAMLKGRLLARVG